jgi:hypothetical protein
MKSSIGTTRVHARVPQQGLDNATVKVCSILNYLIYTG